MGRRIENPGRHPSPEPVLPPRAPVNHPRISPGLSLLSRGPQTPDRREPMAAWRAYQIRQKRRPGSRQCLLFDGLFHRIR